MPSGYAIRRAVNDGAVQPSQLRSAVKYFFEGFNERPIFLNAGANATAFWVGGAGTSNAAPNLIVTQNNVIRVVTTGAYTAPAWDAVSGTGLAFSGGSLLFANFYATPTTQALERESKYSYRPFYESFFVEFKYTITTLDFFGEFNVGIGQVNGALNSGNSYWFRNKDNFGPIQGTAFWTPGSGTSPITSVSGLTTIRITVQNGAQGALVDIYQNGVRRMPNNANGRRSGMTASPNLGNFNPNMAPMFEISQNNNVTVHSVECGPLDQQSGKRVIQ